MSLANSAVSTLLQVAVLGGLPLLAYFIYGRRRHKRTFRETAGRAGLQLGVPRYLVYSLGYVLVFLITLVVWSPSLEPFTRVGSAQHEFVGLGFSAGAIVLAGFYGVLKTGFTEELLFRGLIAGSLSRRLALVWANLLQALIFFMPHLLILLVMPEMWPILPVVFVGALFFGWIRIKSGSILGPWLMHASGNVTMAMMVAIRTSS